jgi:hypothetical protein
LIKIPLFFAEKKSRVIFFDGMKELQSNWKKFPDLIKMHTLFNSDAKNDEKGVTALFPIDDFLCVIF